MRIHMQEALSAQELSHGSWDLAFVGEAVDDRGSAAVAWARSTCSEMRQLAYHAENFMVSVDGAESSVEDLETVLQPLAGSRILLEATTLGFVEIYLCSRLMFALGGTEITLLYLEPGEYRSPRRTQLLHRREFELSEQVLGFVGIPGATLVTTNNTRERAVFFLGYEERRLDVALESLTVRPGDAAVVFGVPAFMPGWEMDAFANNIRVIRDKSISGGTYFCGAENPAAAFGLLDQVHDSLDPDERLVIGPIGTKPCGIGAALFAATHRDVGLLYDHPIRSSKRSRDLGRWHLFKAES